MSRWLWEHDSRTARIARLGLAPASWGMRIAASARAAAYRAGWLGTRKLPLPTVAVGNLTVGGTGKTPVASWIASRLAARGRTPAILLRGYGGDEAAIHRRHVPQAIVIENPDRARSARQAASQGAEVVVLDDAFQRLGIARDLDIVLLAAESLQRSRRILPAGPWREAGTALARADLGVITRKRASAEEAHRAGRWMQEHLRAGCPVAFAELRIAALEGLRSGVIHRPSILQGARVLAVAGIGDPESFRAQLRALGTRVELRAFRDHHPYDANEARRLAADGQSVDHVLMTEKDAVKLRRLWPQEMPEPLVGVLEVCWENEGREIERALDQVLLPVGRRTHQTRQLEAAEADPIND